MKTQTLIIILIVYLIFFRKKAVATVAPATIATSLKGSDYYLLQRDFNEQIALLKAQITDLQGPLA